MKDFLIEKNFKSKNIDIILEKCTELEYGKQDFQELQRVIDYFLKSGYSEDMIVRMIRRNDLFLLLTLEEVENRIKELGDLKYAPKDIKKMLCFNSRILTESLEFVTKVLDYFLEKKLKDTVVRGMTIAMPNIFNYSKEEFDNKLHDIEQLGFTELQAIDAFSHFPQIMEKEMDYIEGIITKLMDCSFTYEQAVHIISLSVNLLRKPDYEMFKKIKFLIDLGLKEVVLNVVFALVPSLETLKAKASYLQNNGYGTPVHLRRYLFIDSSQFKSLFLVSPKEVLVIYRARQELAMSRRIKLEKNGNNA